MYFLYLFYHNLREVIRINIAIKIMNIITYNILTIIKYSISLYKTINTFVVSNFSVIQGIQLKITSLVKAITHAILIGDITIKLVIFIVDTY